MSAGHPSRFDYVTVGHVTVDAMASDGSRRPGGGAFYSALQAARLGARTLILTKGKPREIEELLAPYRGELELHVIAAEHTTTLATAWVGGQRTQRVLAWAGAIEEPIEVDTSILHLAAVARETPSRWQGRAEFVGVTPQGLMREWGESGEISLGPLRQQALPTRFDALVVSETELGACGWLVSQAEHRSLDPKGRSLDPDGRSLDTEHRPFIAVTAGSQPTLVHLPHGAVLQAPAPTVREARDDLGAGDVFAAAFFIALRDRRSPADAAAFGNAAAAVRIAGVGAQAVGDGRAIAEALAL